MSKGRAGFSLFELLAAMAIAALVMVIAGPPVASTLAKIAFRKEVAGVMAQVRGWKLLAVSKGKPVTVFFDQDSVVVRLGQGEEERLAMKENIHLTMEPERLLFSPEGWATPATIAVTSDKRQRRLRINPLTGRPQTL